MIMLMNNFIIEYAEELSMIMISTTTKQSTCDTKENKKNTVRSLIMIYFFQMLHRVPVI